MESLLFGLSVIVNLILVGLVLYYKETIKALVSLQMQRELKKFEKDLAERYERKYKSEKVAELFSRKFNGGAKGEGNFEMERLLWELALWLPKERVCQITEKLVNGKTKLEALELLIEIRKDLGLDDGLKPENVAYLAGRTIKHEKPKEDGGEEGPTN